MTRFEYIEATSGYVHCAVFGCFETTIGFIGDVCGSCIDSGCEAGDYCECEED